MNVEVIPREILPDGRNYFENQLPKDKVLVVHNNWIAGHGRKVERWIKHHMWYVGGFPFPRCEG